MLFPLIDSVNHFFSYLQIKLKKHRGLILFLLLGFFNAFLYVFIVPPWQHYDEPTHFEYVSLIAKKYSIEQRPEFQSAQREIAASMIENNFFENLKFTPNLLLENKSIWIGISQTSDPASYYSLIGNILRLFPNIDPENQLYLARLLSIPFYLLTLFLAVKITNELFEKRSLMRTLVPMSILMLPGLVDIMTAVNNDVAAIAFFSLFLWGCVRILMKGINWFRLIWILSATALCIITKNTVAIAPILLIYPLIIIVKKKQLRIILVFLLLISFTLLLLTILDFNEPANWYQLNYQNQSTRKETTDAPLGNYALRLTGGKTNQPPSIFQVINLQEYPDTSSPNVIRMTVGSYMWADSPTKASAPIIDNYNKHYSKIFDVGKTPKFFSYQVEFPANTKHIKLSLSFPKDTEVNNIYYDGVFVAIGDIPDINNPHFTQENCNKLDFNQKEYNNLVRNCSAELSSISIDPNIDKLSLTLFPVHLSWILGVLSDFNSTGRYFKHTLSTLFQTFWAKFGWSHIPLIYNTPYIILAIFTIFGFIGSFFGFLNIKSPIKKRAFLFFGITATIIWTLNLLRGSGSVLSMPIHIYIPPARYGYPAIIPTMILLSMGWVFVYKFLQKFLPLKDKHLIGGLFLLLLSLDTLSVVSILRYFR